MHYYFMFCLLIGSCAFCQSLSVPQMQIVDPNVAVFAALTYVPTFYPGNWGFYDRQECYNIDGSAAVHIVIFKNIDKIVDTPKMLEKSLSQSFKEIKEYEKEDEKAPEYSQMINQIKRERYKTKEFTTIITGSTTYSPVIVRWEPGLPEFMVKKSHIEAWLKETCPDSSFILRKLIYVSPRDIRYEAVSSKGEIYLIDFSKKKFIMEPIEQIKKDFIAKQSLLVPSDLPESKKQIIEDGIKVQKLRNIQLWKNYETLYKKTKIDE